MIGIVSNNEIKGTFNSELGQAMMKEGQATVRKSFDRRNIDGCCQVDSVIKQSFNSEKDKVTGSKQVMAYQHKSISSGFSHRFGRNIGVIFVDVILNGADIHPNDI